MNEEVKQECNCKEECNCEEECNCNLENQKEEPKEKKKLFKNQKDEKIKELEDNLLRSKAEFINYRKRLEDEQVKMLKYCNEDLIKDMLPILDNFERAISLDDDNLNDDLSKFLSGFKMIYCSFVNVLKEKGVIEIDGNNKPFDPVYHDAIMTELREGIEKDMVLEVLQKGYILKGKVIRPAMVKISQ